MTLAAVPVLAIKDLRLLARDRTALALTLGFPVFYTLFFGAIFDSIGRSARRGSIEVAVVDEDATELSERFVHQLETTPELRVTRESRANAVAHVRLGRQAAYVVVPAGFGVAQERLLWGPPPELELGVDPRRAAETGLLRGVLTRELVDDLRSLFAHPARLRERIERNYELIDDDESLTPADRLRLQQMLAGLQMLSGNGQAEQPAPASAGPQRRPLVRGFDPVKIDLQSVSDERRRPRNAYAVSFPQGMIWGILGAVAGFAVTLVHERTQGTLTRLRASPIGRASILAGKAVACCVTVFVVAFAMLLLAVMALQVDPDSVPLYAAAVVAIAVAFAGLVMLVAALARTEQAAYGLGWGGLTVLAMLGGAIVPVFYMPNWLQPASKISPVYWSLLALEGSMWRSFSPGEMLTPVLILVAIGVFSFALGAAILHRRQGA